MHLLESAIKAPNPTVAVVIPTFNRAGYLRDALTSVFGQTRPVDEVIVVDDGSSDDTPAVVAEFPEITFLRQDNEGPSAARNAGIRAAKSDYVVCLDSDDTLVPTAVERNLACFAENPGVAFVYGAHVRVDPALQPIDRPSFVRIPRRAYHALLQNNYVRMLGAVLFDRTILLAAGGFDSELRHCEDYELFLRLVRTHPVAGHPAVIANYRIHNSNLSARPEEMAISALEVQDRHRPPAEDTVGRRAYRRGQRVVLRMFANAAWQPASQGERARKWEDRRSMARVAPFSSLFAATWQLPQRLLPRRVTEKLQRILSRRPPGIGSVQLGDLERIRPISWHYGYERGTPIDRYYIERFLAVNSHDIRGRMLEVGDATYSRKFGADISQQDILHVRDGFPGATITGDLSMAGLLPAGAFDCMIVTQTLQYIYEIGAAVEELYRGLAPGGTVLATVPGVASVDRGDLADSQFWSMTGQAVAKLFENVFGKGNVEVTQHGNVYAATCFLHGLALEEVEQTWLDKVDPSYPLVVTVRARRAG